ncbi:heavy-metal-associated domain-containing protein [Pseudomonas sp. N040]|nr:cation transporter [Pseudomonas sp. N040]MBF7731688.1 heavy-metal-associated domain-containing protein [Pseudomonas sp. N040]MBW7015332.1 cation transporter [Pseudomonas sp. N040]
MLTFKVEGMSCQHCVRAITGAIQALDGAAQVTVDLTAGQVEVGSTLDQGELLRLLDEQGYPAQPLAGG